MNRWLNNSSCLITLLLVATLFGCKTFQQEPDRVILDGPSQPPTIQKSNQESNVPVALWSPAQRKASAGYYFLVAELTNLRTRDARRALPVFEAAYSLDPNPFLGAKMIAAKAGSGQRQQALLEARKMVLLYPQDAPLRYLHGSLLVSMGDVDDAIRELETSIALDPYYEEAYLELIDLYRQVGQSLKGIASAKQLTENIPASVSGWAQLSRLYLATGQHEKALVPARRAYEMQPTNPGLAQLYALILQLNKKTKQAIAVYESLYRMDPTDQELMSRMVDLYRELGNLEDALELLNELAGVSDGSGRPAVLMQKAIVLWELEKFQEASTLLIDLAQEHPESDRLQYMSGLGLEKLGRIDEAMARYEQLDPSSAFRYPADLRRVIIFRDQKKVEEAIDLAKAVAAGERADADAFILLGGLLGDAKRFDEAISAYDSGYKRFPDMHRLLFLRGVYQERAGDIDACVQTMRQVIIADPTNSSAYNYLGYLFAERGENLDEAEALVKKALELKPGDGFYLDSLGWIYFQKKDYEQAGKYLRQALEIEPKEGVIMEHLGDLEQALNRPDVAKTWFEKALQQKLDERDRKRIEEKFNGIP